jgi:Carboxypeptidase regulatory-like domain
MRNPEHGMPSLPAIVLAAVALAGAGPSAQAPARDTPAPTGTAAIRGRVIAAAGQRPLAKVEVHATAGAMRVNKAVLTDANGRYEVVDLPAGRYTVSTNKENYVRASFGERRPLGPGTPIDVAAGQVVTRIDFALQRTAAITGRVVDEFGDPAPNVMVMPMRYIYVNGERRLQPAGNSGGPTNDLGEYRVYGLIPGRYFVSATSRPMNVMDDAGDRAAYLPTLYPGTANPSEAQRLTVGAGQTIAGVNIPLLPMVGSRVSGVVLDINGKPLTMGSVNVTSRGLNFGNTAFASIRPDGTFTLNALPPGEYTLRASGPGMQEQYAVADVTVSGGDISDVQLVAVNLSSIRGRIVFDRLDQTQKVPQPSVLRVNVIHPQPSPAVLSAMPGGAIPKDDWTFELKTSAGRSILRAGLAAPGNWRLDRILTADGADITDAGFDLPVNGSVDDLVLVMTTRHNEITGTVFDDSGAPVRDCVVVLFARDPQRWSVGTRLLGVSRPDADNLFHLRVAAGDYFAVAFEQLEPSGPSFDDPDILQQLREHAVPFSIGATETKKLDLRLSAPPVY